MHELQKRLDEQIEILQAAKDGKEIERHDGLLNKWVSFDYNDLRFNFGHTFRIKPEPKYKQWEDTSALKVGDVLRHKVTGDECQIIAIKRKVVCDTRNVMLSYFGWNSLSELFSDFEITHDNGKTWEVCGEEVSK